MSSPKQAFPAGTHVTLLGMKRSGIVQRGPNSRSEYLVAINSLQIWVKESELRQSAQPEAKKKASRKKSKTNSKADAAASTSSSATLTIDLHGMTVEQSLEILEKTLDRALLQDAGSIEVVHGRGSGKLQQTVSDFALRSPQVARCSQAVGNPGMSVLWLK